MTACDNALVPAAYAAHNIGCGYADQIVKQLPVVTNARLQLKNTDGNEF